MPDKKEVKVAPKKATKNATKKASISQIEKVAQEKAPSKSAINKAILASETPKKVIKIWSNLSINLTKKLNEIVELLETDKEYTTTIDLIVSKLKKSSENQAVMVAFFSQVKSVIDSKKLLNGDKLIYSNALLKDTTKAILKAHNEKVPLKEIKAFNDSITKASQKRYDRLSDKNAIKKTKAIKDLITAFNKKHELNIGSKITSKTIFDRLVISIENNQDSKTLSLEQLKELEKIVKARIKAFKDKKAS